MRNIGQVASKEREGLYLDVASKEEGGVRNIPDAVAATAGQGFLLDRAHAPPPLQGSISGGQSHGMGAARWEVAAFRFGQDV
jgi:hypothetical protein